MERIKCILPARAFVSFAPVGGLTSRWKPCSHHKQTYTQKTEKPSPLKLTLLCYSTRTASASSSSRTTQIRLKVHTLCYSDYALKGYALICHPSVVETLKNILHIPLASPTTTEGTLTRLVHVCGHAKLNAREPHTYLGAQNSSSTVQHSTVRPTNARHVRSTLAVRL